MLFSPVNERTRRNKDSKSRIVTFSSGQQDIINHVRDIVLKMLAQASCLTQIAQIKLQGASNIQQMLQIFRDYHLQRVASTWTPQRDVAKMEVYLDKKQKKIIEQLNKELQEKQNKICELISAYEEAKTYFLQEVNELKISLNRFVKQNQSLRESKECRERTFLRQNCYKNYGSINPSYTSESPLHSPKLKKRQFSKELFKAEKFIEGQKSSKMKKNFIFQETDLNQIIHYKGYQFLIKQIKDLKKSQYQLVENVEKQENKIKDLMSIINQNRKNSFQAVYF